MNFLFKTTLFAALLLARSIPASAQNPESTSYKCMLQMTNYMGEGAYIVVSLIDPKGNYEKTLQVFGSDKKWYPDLAEWHKFYKKKSENITAITGASVAGGERTITVLQIENSKINSGYVLRFESAVEDQKYHTKDLEIQLTTENLSAKSEGTGYIRYVRLTTN